MVMVIMICSDHPHPTDLRALYGGMRITDDPDEKIGNSDIGYYGPRDFRMGWHRVIVVKEG